MSLVVLTKLESCYRESSVSHTLCNGVRYVYNLDTASPSRTVFCMYFDVRCITGTYLTRQGSLTGNFVPEEGQPVGRVTRQRKVDSEWHDTRRHLLNFVVIDTTGAEDTQNKHPHLGSSETMKGSSKKQKRQSVTLVQKTKGKGQHEPLQ